MLDLDKEKVIEDTGIDMEFLNLLENTDEIIYIRDNKETYNEIAGEVAVCYDKDGYILLKIGGLNFIEEYCNTTRNAYLSAGTHSIYEEMARNLEYIILPKNQELVDRVFNTTGYLGIYIENIRKLTEN